MTIEQARKTLGKEGEKYTDEQVQQIIINLGVLADIAIETFNKLAPEQKKLWVKKSKDKQNVK